MCKLQCKTRKDDRCNTSKQNNDFGETSWNDVEQNDYLNNKIIQICNVIPLSAVFKRYGILFESDSYSEWQHINCPFKDHDDYSPSFGYNKTKDVFNCFGCGRYGRAVHFISFYEDIPIQIVVKQISKYFENIIPHQIKSTDYNALNSIMQHHSSIIREFLHKFVDDPDELQASIHYVDVLNEIYDEYIRSTVEGGNIDLSYLKFLSEYIEEQINLYGEE